MERILIVEDERAIRQLLAFILRPAGYEIIEAADAMSAMDAAASTRPNLVLLDWQLPDMDGLRLLKFWRADETTARVPIIMVSARITESDRVAGLRAGADDYVTKPFSRDELLARVQALLRRAANSSTGMPEIREFGGLALNLRSLRVTASNRQLPLGPIEFRLLNLFMSQPERALTRGQIVDRVWRGNAYVDERTVDVHVRRLRAALEPTGHDMLVQTVRGVGYRFTAGPAAPAGVPPADAASARAPDAGPGLRPGAEPA